MIGYCLCEKVSFEISGELPDLYQCHCSACRRVTGSSNNSGLLVGPEQFCWLRGEQSVSLYIKDTGYHSSFCSHCGSAMPNPLRDGSGYWVPAGALPEGQLEVGAHLFVSDKADWDYIGDKAPQYESFPGLDLLRQRLKK